MANIQEQIEILVSLQSVEMEILQVDRQIISLNGEADALDRAAADREAAFGAEKEALGDLKKAYRELESESKINAESIVKSNEKLRAVKTNKEYQSILKEIEELRKRNSGVEDRMIELLEEIEAQEASAREKEDQLADFVQTCRERKKVLAGNVNRERHTVDGLNEKKAQIRGKADPETIAIFDAVRKKVRGIAVAPAQQAICMGCHMNIPPQLFNELLRFDEFRFCPHCNRILYWKEEDGE
jgi:predicted  nucleic acid-binding Zn-ribbon protein